MSPSSKDRGFAARMRHWLRIPETEGIDYDDPRLTDMRLRIIKGKPFLFRFYRECYRHFLEAARDVPAGLHIELGSGGGFFQEMLPHVIRSEVQLMGAIDAVFSAEALPFRDGEAAAFYLLDVLHHIPHPRRFFAEAARCLPPGGRVVMIEPYNTAWGRWVWTHLHHEAFEPGAGWELAPGGPLSRANGAMPWIIFHRDRELFQEAFPSFRIVRIQPMMPWTYLLSGGVSMRALVPGAMYGWIRAMERALGPLNRSLGMFALIVLERR